MEFAILIHVLSVVVWVGGMFFAYVALRPAAAILLEPPLRLSLWNEVFRRFFPWVWASVVLVIASGLYLIMALGGFKAMPINIHVMFSIGLLMSLVFCFVYWVPYGKLRQSVKKQEWAQGGQALAMIRKLIALNLSLGMINIAVAVIGRLASI